MPVSLHFEFQDPPPRSDETTGPVDPWPDGLDDLVAELRGEEARLSNQRRLDAGIAIGVVVVGGVLATLSAKLAIALLLIFLVLLAGIVYLPLRGRPREEALLTLASRLAILDPRCTGCGYAVRHLLGNRCPECGRRIEFPSRRLIEQTMKEGTLEAPSGRVSSDLGWIVMALMIMTAIAVGGVTDGFTGIGAAAIPASVFLAIHIIRHVREGGRVPPFSICDTCGKSTSVRQPTCTHCGATLMADHVFVHPTMRGELDPRLSIMLAKIIGGICACAALALVPAIGIRLGFVNWSETPLTAIQAILAVSAVALLSVDIRRRSAWRRTAGIAIDEPRCGRCTGSLAGLEANGACPHCRRDYTALDLLGARREAPDDAVAQSVTDP